MMRMGVYLGAAALALLVGAVPARASSITFLGEDTGAGESTRLTSYSNALSAETNFLSYLDSGVTTQGFDALSTGRSNFSTTFSASGSSSIQTKFNGSFFNKVAAVSGSGTDGYGRYAISGSKYYDALTTVTITFGTDVSAFGFWGVDVGDFNGQLMVTTNTTADNTGVKTSYVLDHSKNAKGGGVIFWGLLTDAKFRQVKITNTGTGFDRFALDDVTIGDRKQITRDISPVPEPATLLLMGVGLAGLGAARKRRLRR